MNLLIAILFIVVGFIFLVKGADLFVESASSVAKKLGVSSLIIGLTIVAFGTSMPELAVSVTAALQGANEIAVGNVVGSNIINLLIVAGGSACIYPIVVNKTILNRDWPISIIAAVLLIIMLIDQKISILEGAILLVCFVTMLAVQIKQTKKSEDIQADTNDSFEKLFLFLIIGIAGIVIGGQLVVDGATSLARIMGLSETLIGLTIVAFGTSLPELVTSLVAAKKGENEIAMGNVIGSNLFNIFCILGVSAVLHPIAVEATAIIDALILVLVSIVFWLLCRIHKFDRKIGTFMLITYFSYMIYIIIR